MDNQKLIGEIRIGITRLMDDVKKANLELEKINQGKDFKEINIKADIGKIQSEVQQLNQTLAKTTDLNIDTSNATSQLSQFKQKVVSMTDEAGHSVQKLLSEMSRLNLGTGVSARVTQGYDLQTQTPLNPVAEYNIDFGKIAKERQAAEIAADKQIQEEYVRGWTSKIKEVESQRIAAIKAEEMAEKQLQDEYVRGQTARINEVETRNINEQRQQIADQNNLYKQQEQILAQIYQTDLRMVTARANERTELAALRALDQERLNINRQDISSRNLVNQERQNALMAQELRYQQQIDVAQGRQLDNIDRQNTSLTGTGTILGKFFNVAVYSAGYYIFNAFATSIKNAISFTNELNKSMTNMEMITGNSHESIVKMTKDYSDLASTLHETTLSIMTAAEEFIRAGNSAEETSKLLQASTVMSKIAGTEQKESAQSMIAIMNSYKMSASEMMSIVDKMVAIDNTSATSTRELSAAIKDTAQSAQLAGSSFDNIISYIGTVSSVSRKSADTIGQAFFSGGIAA